MLTTPHFVLFLSTISRVMFLLQGQFWGIKVSAATFHLRNVDRMNELPERILGKSGALASFMKNMFGVTSSLSHPFAILFPQCGNGLITSSKILDSQWNLFLAASPIRGVLKNKWIRLQPECRSL